MLRLGTWALRAHARTLRITVENEEPVRAHLAAGGRLVFASWHQRFYGGICWFRRYAPVIMISQSRDGELIARLVELLGWATARGSTSRGGRDALDAMIDLLHDPRSGRRVAGHIVDGPRGPARRIKPGLARLARAVDARIVPVYVAYARAWQARSWDRFMVPAPGSRMLLRFGRLIDVPPGLGEEDLKRWCRELDAEFEREYARADADVGARGGDASRRPRASSAS